MANANSRTPTAGTSPESIESVIKQAFGKCSEDVLLAPKASVEAFGWISSICKCIEEEARKSDPNTHHIAKLAGAGKFLATDYENFVDCEREMMVDALADVGIKPYAEASHV